MNQSHLTYLAGPEWARALRADLLPWLRQVADLGDHVLEIGPGPGLTTELLLGLTDRVTAVEVDGSLADALRVRLRGRPVDVIHGDGTQVDIPPHRFSAATCFSMLHHMDSPAAQDRLFARLSEVLRPGAVFVGVDSVDSEMIRRGHIDDTFTPVDPGTLEQRLHAVGFTEVHVTPAGEHQFRFVAAKPRN